MNLRLFGCGKFRYLSNEALDRPLRAGEERFMERHRAACSTCHQTDLNQHLALNMLRASALSPEPEDSFDRRLVRRARLQGVRAQFSYWSPTAIGATIATVLVLSILQVVARPGGVPERDNPAGAAMRTDARLPLIPDLHPDPNVRNQ